jgi:argininosuccinate lyase
VQAQRLYAETAAAFGLPADLPLTEQEFRRALSAEGMVRASQGLGGPQPAEVTRMLIRHREGLAADRNWVTATRYRWQR